MAIPERDTVYSNDGTNRTVYSRESSSTGWFVGIIVALALLAIGYLVFSANSGPSTTSTTVNNTPTIESPVTDPAMTTPTAPSTGTETTTMEAAPATPAPATEAPAPSTDTTAPATTPAPAIEAPATTEPAPAQ